MIPDIFQRLIRRGCLTETELYSTADGFWAVGKSLADILTSQGILTLPNSQGLERDCQRFFDDWHLYAVPGETEAVYSLFKLREQEFDRAESVIADGDTPGVTVCFIAFDAAVLMDCLEDPSFSRRQALNVEINRVVAARNQRHHRALKAYFVSPKAEGPYFIAQLYVRHIASFAREGCLDVPEYYASLYQKHPTSRLSRFLEENNSAAGRTVCDHKRLYFHNPAQLTIFEKQAILATHTANVSFHSFAAEVRYHARFLVWYARFPLRSIYASAIRADMTIDDRELQGSAPYYRLNSRWIKNQEKYHKEQ